MSAKNWVVMVAVGFLALAGGWLARGKLAPAQPVALAKAGGAVASPCPGGAKPAYWKAPMNPSYVRDAPGKSPMGMDLVPVCPGEEAGAASGAVRIDPTTIQNIGVRTAPVVRRDIAREIRAVGRVDYDEQLLAQVHTKVQGWVEKLHIDYEGQIVKKGQPLLEIYSPELVSTQEELLVAARYRDALAKSPVEDVARGGADLLQASRRRLELWDIPDADIERLLRTRKVRKTLTLYAPSSGVVTQLKVREGMEVGLRNNLYTIADLSRVWVYADLYEYELPWVAVGQQATMMLSYLPGQLFEGQVAYVYPYLEQKTRTQRVRLEMPNPKGLLKPEMFANVTIATDARRNVLAVPEEAILRSGRRNVAIVALPGGRFLPREVTLGIDSGDGWLEVRSGISEGERVVTSSQFLIDSESKLQEAAQKLLAKKKAPPAPGDASMEGMK